MLSHWKSLSYLSYRNLKIIIRYMVIFHLSLTLESYPRFYSLQFRILALQTLTNFYNKMTLFIWKTPQTNIFDNLDVCFVFIRSQLFWLFRHPFPFSMIGRKLVKPLSKTDQNTQNLSFKWRHKWLHKCVRIRITHEQHRVWIWKVNDFTQTSHSHCPSTHVSDSRTWHFFFAV